MFGFEDFEDIFFFWGGGVTTKLDLFEGSILCILGSLLLAQCTEWEYYLGLLKYKTFLGYA